jgi:hypothetical protein
MKGGPYHKWYGNQEYVVNWRNDAEEIDAFRPASVIRNPGYYFREGVTWTDLGASGFSARISPGGFVFDVSGSCAFPETEYEIPQLLAVMNAISTGYLLSLVNPTMHFQVGDLTRLPVPVVGSSNFLPVVVTCVRASKLQAAHDESTFDFIAPLRWDTGLGDMAAAQARLAELERQIDDEVYRLYGISDEDRAAIEAELAGGTDTEEEAESEAPMTVEELAVRWISYAVGIALGRFQAGGSPSPQPSPQKGEGATPLPGREGLGEGWPLGSAVYRRQDFAVGSLPAPDEAEFDQLVGPPERFACVDADGGRHLFPAEVEAALRDLAVPDGITVLDKGHPRDLPTLVDKALTLMLGAEAIQKVIAEGANGDLRKFLERDFFTKWHLKWYRKRPVYWPLQSAKRSYGFVLFHEKINKATLYVLQRDYLDHKLNGLRLHIGDLTAQLAGKEGRARKQVERQIDKASQLLDEITEFAQAMEQVVREGYEPAPDWIDDGVILRLAPLWELIPIWKHEPKKYWERLQQGDYDWSHIAMRYWPERVQEKCKTNKSYAIAHGHEEWYEGN